MPPARLTAVRYLVPLREGGSLPAIVDTEPPGEFVIKFRGAGQGPRALVAELLAAGLAEALDLPVPRTAIVSLAEGFGLNEPDPEIQDLLRASAGLNFGIEYLPGAIGFDASVDRRRVDPGLAADIVWFDALISNVDRTARNPNLLLWQGSVWLIDHGAAFYFHHAGDEWQDRARARFPLIKDHILLRRASPLSEAAERLRPRLSEAALRSAVEALPDEWLGERAQALRDAYLRYLLARLTPPLEWLEEAEDARRRA
jgi:hypothetical protein